MINSQFPDEESKTYSQFYTRLNRLINAFSNDRKYQILALVDISLFLVAISIALSLESRLGLLPSGLWHYSNFVVMEIAMKIGFFWFFGIYQQVLRRTSNDFIVKIAQAVLVSCLAIATLDRLWLASHIPTSALILDGILTLLLASAFRLTVRLTLGKKQPLDAAPPKPSLARKVKD
jgi:FlaA1/EpsC-like NDP-sugar epimerase